MKKRQMQNLKSVNDFPSYADIYTPGSFRRVLAELHEQEIKEHFAKSGARVDFIFVKFKDKKC